MENRGKKKEARRKILWLERIEYRGNILRLDESE